MLFIMADVCLFCCQSVVCIGFFIIVLTTFVCVTSATRKSSSLPAGVATEIKGEDSAIEKAKGKALPKSRKSKDIRIPLKKIDEDESGSKDMCSPNPCLNKGLCRPYVKDEDQKYRCSCPLGRSGNVCEKETDYCGELMCHLLTDCVSTPEGALCICDLNNNPIFCRIILKHTTEWGHLEFVKSPDSMNDVESETIFIMGPICLIALLICIHCIIVTIKRQEYRDLYDAVVKTGELPANLPPDWLDVHKHLLKRYFRLPSTLPENFSKNASQNYSARKKRKGKRKTHKGAPVRLSSKRMDSDETLDENSSKSDSDLDKTSRNDKKNISKNSTKYIKTKLHATEKRSAINKIERSRSRRKRPDNYCSSESNKSDDTNVKRSFHRRLKSRYPKDPDNQIPFESRSCGYYGNVMLDDDFNCCRTHTHTNINESNKRDQRSWSDSCIGPEDLSDDSFCSCLHSPKYNRASPGVYADVKRSFHRRLKSRYPQDLNNQMPSGSRSCGYYGNELSDDELNCCRTHTHTNINERNMRDQRSWSDSCIGAADLSDDSFCSCLDSPKCNRGLPRAYVDVKRSFHRSLKSRLPKDLDNQIPSGSRSRGCYGNKMSFDEFNCCRTHTHTNINESNARDQRSWSDSCVGAEVPSDDSSCSCCGSPKYKEELPRVYMESYCYIENENMNISCNYSDSDTDSAQYPKLTEGSKFKGDCFGDDQCYLCLKNRTYKGKRHIQMTDNNNFITCPRSEEDCRENHTHMSRERVRYMYQSGTGNCIPEAESNSVDANLGLERHERICARDSVVVRERKSKQTREHSYLKTANNRQRSKSEDSYERCVSCGCHSDGDYREDRYSNLHSERRKTQSKNSKTLTKKTTKNSGEEDGGPSRKRSRSSCGKHRCRAKCDERDYIKSKKSGNSVINLRFEANNSSRCRNSVNTDKIYYEKDRGKNKNAHSRSRSHKKHKRRTHTSYRTGQSDHTYAHSSDLDSEFLTQLEEQEINRKRQIQETVLKCFSFFKNNINNDKHVRPRLKSNTRKETKK